MTFRTAIKTGNLWRRMFRLKQGCATWVIISTRRPVFKRYIGRLLLETPHRVTALTDSTFKQAFQLGGL